MEQNSCIVTENIEKVFQSKTVLKNINLHITEGEIFGLLGPSGAGKTTLINILTGQIKQSKGVVKLFGKDNQNIDRETYQKMGMVLDNTGLYERLSCYDNLLLFARIHGVDKKNIDVVLKKVGLLDSKNKSINKLSKGMKQRLVFARAILHNPKILFLDEPTSGLDPVIASLMHQLILEEKEKGTTIFLTTHNMEEATKLCDNVALLNQGEIVEYGSPLEICRKYNHQNKIRIVTKVGEEIILENAPTSSSMVAEYLDKNLVMSIHSTEPNLETVFMELTGRRLEDE